MDEIKKFSLEDAMAIGNQLGIKWDTFDVEQFALGLNVELEHGSKNILTNVTNDDPLLTGKIAWAHLNECSDYYVRLATMEEEAEAYYK